MIERRDIFIAILSIIAVLAFIPIFTYVYFAGDLTSKERLMNRNNTGVVLLDRNNKPFFSFYSGRESDYVDIDKVPEVVKQAIISAEDKEFYSHPGFSIRAILGAIWADIKQKEFVYGASTITQQLVKNSLLTNQKSFLRKYQELVLAQEIERRFTKDEILEMYLNSAYFGEGAFGIGDAAKVYFDKSANDLNLSEASLLAGILTSPSKYSPLNGGLDEAKQRQRYVLKEMREGGYISLEKEAAAFSRELTFNKKPSDLNSVGAHFAIHVRNELIEKYGSEEAVSRSGFKVQTTLDLDWQKEAEKIVEEQVEKLKRNRVSNGSAVVIDPKNGEVRVLVGSKDWYNEEFGKFDVTAAKRQPGSAFKPIVYAAALERNLITAATVLKDEPITYNIQGSPPYRPQNYDRKFRGDVLVRRALANSLNVPTIEVMNKLGVSSALEFSKKMGITTFSDDPSDYGLSLGLGAGEVKLIELTNAYATFANKGVQNDITYLREIKDKYDNKIFTNYPKNQKTIEPGVAYIISSILSDNQARQEVFGSALTTGKTAAVKTGTTENYRDALTVGFTPNLTVGVWVGNNDGTVMDNIAGSLGAAPIWRILIEKFSEGNEKFEEPEGIVKVQVCRNNGLRAREATSSGLTEYFIKGTEPVRFCVIAVPSPSTSPSSGSSDVRGAQRRFAPVPSNRGNRSDLKDDKKD